MEICCISCIYMKNLTLLYLFHFIFELLIIFMVKMNIIKIELVNDTENDLLHIFSVTIFLQTELSLSIQFFWSRSKGADIIRANILCKILSNRWELKVVYQQNFLVGNKLATLFLTKVFPSS